MKSGRKMALATIVVALAMQLLFPSLLQASGVGVTPALIEMNDALRGAEYQNTVMLTNAETAAVTFEFVPEGEAGQWVTLYPFNGPDTPMTTFVAPAMSDVPLRLKLRLPQDAPNGLHTGRLVFRSAVSGQDAKGTSMAVSLGIAVELKLTLTGNQKVAGKVSDVSLLNVEVDQPPLRLTTQFQNTGNVKTTPRIQLQVKDAQSKLVKEASFSEVAVEPGGYARIESEWDHSGNAAGKYVAAVAVFLESGEKIYERELNFEMLPKGTMTRVGKLDEIKLGSEPQAGGTVKLVGVFQNTGKIDTKAILTAEVYRGANLLRAVESKERVIPAGQIGDIEVFFDIPEPDSYVVKAKVNYEGKLTETKELSFTAGGVARSGNSSPVNAAASVAPVTTTATSSSGESSLVLLTGGAAVLIAVLWGGSTVLQRRKARVADPPQKQPRQESTLGD